MSYKFSDIDFSLFYKNVFKEIILVKDGEIINSEGEKVNCNVYDNINFPIICIEFDQTFTNKNKEKVYYIDKITEVFIKIL